MLLAAWLLNVGSQSPGEAVSGVSAAEGRGSDHSIVWSVGVETFSVISDEGTRGEIYTLTSYVLVVAASLFSLKQMAVLPYYAGFF